MKKPSWQITALLRKSCLLLFTLCYFQGFASLVAQNLSERVTLPGAAGFVNDFAGVMARQDQQAAENLATTIRERTGAELVIVTIESLASQGSFSSIDEFSLALAQSWGIGQRGQDNGVLIVLAMSEREVKIEVGYGLEGAIPDSVAGRILDTILIPAFRQEDFSGGLLKGLEAIAALVARESGLDLEELNLSTAAPAPAQDVPWMLLLPLIWIILIILLSSRSRRRFRRGVVITSFGGGTRGFGGSRHFGSGFGGGSFSGSRSFGGFSGGSFGGGGAFRRF